MAAQPSAGMVNTGDIALDLQMALDSSAKSSATGGSISQDVSTAFGNSGVSGSSDFLNLPVNRTWLYVASAVAVVAIIYIVFKTKPAVGA